jgi:radical SAM protein with 4Fe4S-binding SPASM domain
MNVAQVSGHYYDNGQMDGMVADPAKVRSELDAYRRLRGRPRSVAQVLENTYLDYLNIFLQTGQTPMPCHALRASCFIDPWGVVYPCISYSKPIGRLRETGMRLDPIWNAPETETLQREIWEGSCPQCWTACEAYQSILGNVLAGRCGSRRGVDLLPSPSSGATR